MNNDLISREALKKLAIPCEIHNGALTDMCVPLYQIDNAPAVDLTEEYLKGYLQGCEDTIKKVNELNTIRFSKNCGADMRKGGAE